MKKYIFIAIGLVLASCKHELNPVEKKLVDPHKKWVVVRHKGKVTREMSFVTYFKFFKNGTLEEYNCGYDNLFGKSTWSYSVDDNILKLYDDYYVLKEVTIYEDSIIAKDTKDKDNRFRIINWYKLPER